MMKRVLVLMLAGLVCVGTASANLVTNPGFEDQNLATNGYVYDVQGYNDDYFADHAYVVHPGDAWNLVSPHSGNNVMVMVGDSNSTHMGVLQDLSMTMTPGTTYTVSGYVSKLAGYGANHYFLSILNKRTGKHVGSITSDPTYVGDWPISFGTVAGDCWTEVTAPSYTATADDAGYGLQLSLWTWKPSSAGYYDYTFAAWDDLSVTAVPEPMTLGLLSLGGLLLARRKV